MPLFQLQSTKMVLTIRFQPTYRMEPQRPFKYEIVEGVMHGILDLYTETVKYNPRRAPCDCRTIAEDIKSQIKKLKFDRLLFNLFLI